MTFFSTERVTWLRKHQRVTHGVMALFWAAVFLFFFYQPNFSLEVGGIYLRLPDIRSELRGLDYKFADILARSGRLTPDNPEIVFLGIDDASQRLDVIDPQIVQKNHILSLMAHDWPWDREIYAAVLDRLYQAGAKVVIFDVLCTQERPSDPLFHAALDRAKGRVIIGANYVSDASTNLTSTYNQFKDTLTLPADSLLPQTVPVDERTGLVNFWPDEDHIIRRTGFRVPYPGSAIGEVKSKEKVYPICAQALRLTGGENLIPEGEKTCGFRFTGPPGSFQGCSIYQLFYQPDWDGQFQKGAYFKDKIVMVGPKGNFQQDQHNTPFGLMDGAEIHLNAMNALLHGELLYYVGDNPGWVMLLVTLGAFIAWLLGITMQRVTIRRAVLCAVLSVLFALLYFYAGITLYGQGIILVAAAPLGTLGFTIFSGLSGQYILEQMERTRTRRFFERYVSSKVVSEILDNPSGYYDSLSGRRRQVTVLFSDLRGFTSMTEKADSEQLVSDLNEYLRGMNRALFKHDGILDKFIGDAVMAVWGSFQPKPEQDTRNAVLAALAMHQELVDLNVIRAQRGAAPLAMGVGINHGEAIVGDIGSDQQMNFTVIGDSVNLASRLEGTTKEYGVGLLISETVEEFVRPHFHLQTVDSIVVKGRVKPVMTYTVLGPKETPLSPEKAAYLEKFELAMRLYRSEKFAEAREGFAACLVLEPNDKLSKIFQERSIEFIVTPPPQPWDGSYTMKTK